jgi:hypothetical protein
MHFFLTLTWHSLGYYAATPAAIGDGQLQRGFLCCKFLPSKAPKTSPQSPVEKADPSST